MAASESDNRLVVLRGGLIVPAPAYILFLELERHAFSLSRECSATLVVRPAERLTPELCIAIKRWKLYLLLLLDYCAQPLNDAHLFRDDQRVGDTGGVSGE